MEKKSKTGKLIVLSILALALLSLLVSLLTFNSFNFFQFSTTSKLLHDEVYSYQGLTKIDVRTISSDVNILNTDEDSIRVVIYGRDNKNISVTTDVNQLKIDIDNRNVCIGICFSMNDRVDVYVPNNYQNELNIKTTSGDINVGSYKANNFIIKSISGDIIVDASRNLKANSTSGNIKVGTANNPSLSSISGDIRIKNATNSLKLKTTSGNVKLGTVYLTKNSTISSISGDITIEKINEVYIDASTLSGDIDIFSNSRKADIVLKIKTTSGDIEIN